MKLGAWNVTTGQEETAYGFEGFFISIDLIAFLNLSRAACITWDVSTLFTIRRRIA